MNSVKRIFALIVVGAGVSSASVAEAGSVYQFAFDQLTYEVDPGTQVLVNVFLQEQVSAGTSSVLATDGLIGAGVRVSFDLSPLPSDPAKVLGVSGVLPNDGSGGFTGGLYHLGVASGSYAELSETVGLSSPPIMGTDLGGGLFEILIGTFRFTAGSIAGQTTLIQAGDIPGFSEIVTNTGEVLDALIAPGTASIHVRGEAVPEPSSWIVLALGLIGVGGYGLTQYPLRTSSGRPML